MGSTTCCRPAAGMLGEMAQQVQWEFACLLLLCLGHFHLSASLICCLFVPLAPLDSLSSVFLSCLHLSPSVLLSLRSCSHLLSWPFTFPPSMKPFGLSANCLVCPRGSCALFFFQSPMTLLVYSTFLHLLLLRLMLFLCYYCCFSFQ